ncbi:MAG: UDP-N-acetylglucosamine 2-epimerase (non-hydrolyzing) [Acidobacteria bacterium]|nr:UDP-N-acetylglucosamine 2-epimerase (non-hydrolyzing) [Acidobacteriota bacterium]
MDVEITVVAGARPNFMKVAPILSALKRRRESGCPINHRLVHTGQHSSTMMSDTFFEQLGIPSPDVNLNVSGGSHARQTAEIMMAFEADLEKNPTDLVIVVGDINSTMAATIVAKKLCIPVAHVEGGLRSGDMTMPEEINRKVTDSIADFFFTTSKNASENLIREGIGEERVFFVGNTMIDSLLINLDKLERPRLWNDLNLKERGYLLLTLHRPANVDSPALLNRILEVVSRSAGSFPVIFPVHPRTQKSMEEMSTTGTNIFRVDPMGYLEFIYLLKNSKGVITDSGGITEEATVLDIPCVTARTTTERPETVEVGTNVLLGSKIDSLPGYISEMIAGTWRKASIPELWDGNAADRIADAIVGLWESGRIGRGNSSA